MHALGVLGGDLDENLTCFLVATAKKPDELVMIDGGSVTGGITRWLEKSGKLAADATWTQRARAVTEVLSRVKGTLITHAHLDHVGGLVTKSTLDLSLAQKGRESHPLIGLPATIEGLHEKLLSKPAWGDFTTFPPERPALKLDPMPPGTPRTVGPFTVTAIELSHSIPAAGFVLEADGGSYLHLGDTGPTEAIWKAGREALEKGTLRGVAVEVSFPDAEEKLSLITAHFTPHLLLLELAKLTGVTPRAAPTPAEADKLLVEDLIPKLTGVKVMAIHIKALYYDTVTRELRAYQERGLPIILPEQGGTYEF